MTSFLCQELLFEHISGQLGPVRQKQIDEYLETDRESQRELEKLLHGIDYSKSLQQIDVTASLHQALLNFEPNWKKKLQDWTLWSSRRGWRVLPPIFLVITVILLSIVLVKRQGQEVVLVADQHIEAPTTGDSFKRPADAPVAQSATAAAVQATAPTETTVEDKTTQANPEPTTPAPSPISPPPAALAKPTPAAVAASQAQTSPIAPIAATTRSPKPAEGSLRRSEVAVERFAEAWPAIKEKIESLGGKAAGNVQLGWKRKATQSYFHFSLPESKFSELEAFIGTFGPVQFTTERHPRVMPEGQIRIILTLKDVGSDESAAEAP